jgi:hypothetical protein
MMLFSVGEATLYRLFPSLVDFLTPSAESRLVCGFFGLLKHMPRQHFGLAFTARALFE